MAIIQAFVGVDERPPRPFCFRVVHKIGCGDDVPRSSREWTWELAEFQCKPGRLRDLSRTLRRFRHRDDTWRNLQPLLLL